MFYVTALIAGETVEGWTAGDYDHVTQYAYQHPRRRMVSSVASICPLCSQLAVFSVDRTAHPNWMDPNETGVLCLDCGFDGMCWCGCIANETGFCCDNCRKEANQ